MTALFKARYFISHKRKFQQHGETSYHQDFFLQDKALKQINTMLTQPLGEHVPS